MKIFNQKYINRQFINKNEDTETYSAINSITNNTVILKVINNESNINELKDKINILKNIENKNLIATNTIGSFIENDKTYYYIETEDFPSESLSEKMKDYKFTPVEAVKILRQVCEGLREFHFKGLVYGNLSCENIYIDSNGLVKVDTLDCLNIKEADENLSEEDDIFSLGVILFQLVTGKMEFKPGKCKSEISDKDLLFIIDRCTNKKYAAYEDLNKFIEDLNSYIEYGGISSRSYKSANEELYDEYDEVELYESPYKFKPIKLIRNIGACVLLFLMIATVINGGSILNLNKNKENIEATNNSTAVTESNKEIAEEVAEEEQEPAVTDVYDENYNNQPVYNNIEEENSNNNYGYTNNSTPVIRPNYNANNSTPVIRPNYNINNNTSNNNNSNNNIQNSGNNTNNNLGNNTNTKPDDEDVNNGGNTEEETPQIPSTPDVTPDSGNTEGDNSEGESEV